VLTKNQLTTIILIAALVWGGLLVTQGVAVSASWFKPLTAVIGAMMAILAAFNLWLWRLPIFRGWLVKRPVIAGTWKAHVRPTWIDPSTDAAKDPFIAYMVVRQTYASLSMRLLTAESSSVALAADFDISADGLFTVSGVYRNEPRMAVRDQSAMHHGALLLQVVGTPPSTLRGHYWTDRRSTGDLELTDRRDRVFDDFASASAIKQG